METSACGKTVVHFSPSPMIIKTEAARKAECPVDDTNTPAVNEKAVCEALIGLTINYNIPTDGRYTIYLQCPDAVPMCYFTYSNTAGNNMKAFKLQSSTLTNEGVIAQEINTYGEFKFRKSTIYLMFVSMDEKNPQTLTFNYMSGHALLVGFLGAVTAIFTLMF